MEKERGFKGEQGSERSVIVFWNYTYGKHKTSSFYIKRIFNLNKEFTLPFIITRLLKIKYGDFF